MRATWCQVESQAGRARGSEIMRNLWLFVSTTMMTLYNVIARSEGPLNFALVPVPSANAALVLLPASVETSPRGVTSRIRLFPASAIVMTPVRGLIAMPCGALNLAVVATPSRNNGNGEAVLLLPASVETMPS